MSKKPAIFSEKQQTKTLSAKLNKKANKLQLKNVLAQPFERYWPQIKDAQTNQLIKQWQTLNISPKRIIKGLNATLRSLKQGNIQILFISANIKPKYIVEQIILLALGHNPNVQILCIPNLSDQLSLILNFTSCICVSFLNGELDDIVDFNKLKKTCLNLSEQFQLPNYLKKQQKKVKNEENKSTINNNANKSNIADMQPISFDKLYVTKSNEQNERQFVPHGTVFKENPLLQLTEDRGHQDWGDFLSLSAKNGVKSNEKVDFSQDLKSSSLISVYNKKMKKKLIKNQGILLAKQSSKNNKNNIKEQFNYVTLKVNKIQPNPNKIKKNKKQKKK